METCVKCNGEFTHTITDHAFDEWCESCADMHLFKSEHSEDYFPRSERINVKGHYIHESEEEEFLEDNYNCCEKCGNHVEEELWTVDDIECCDSCKEDAYWDDFAEERTFDEIEQVVDTRGMYVASDRHHDHDVHRCEHCGDLYTSESIDYRDREDEWICNGCYEEHYTNERINSYDYKPMPVFYQGKNQQQGKYFKARGVYFGIELEIAHDNVDSLIYDVPEMVDNDKFYLKEDGSIEGVELVTHPLTYNAIKETNFKKLLKQIADADGSSHNAGNCGLHIHVSKNKVPTTSWWKIIYFFQECSDFINKFSRRNDRGYCHSRETSEYGFNREKGILLDDYKRYPNSPNKYSEINTTSKTVEFRVYRGTLKYQTFLASVQFTKAIIEFCNDHGIVYMGSLSSPSMLWSEFISYISKNNNYGHLVKYLKKKEIYRLESNVSRSIKDNGKLSVSKFLTGKRDKVNLSSFPKVINTLNEEDCTLMTYNDAEQYPFRMRCNGNVWDINPIQRIYCATTAEFLTSSVAGTVADTDSQYRSSSDPITKQVDFFNIATKVVYGIVHRYSDAENYYILLDDSHKEIVEGAVQGSGFSELHDVCNELIQSHMDFLLETQLEQTTNL